MTSNHLGDLPMAGAAKVLVLGWIRLGTRAGNHW